MLGMETVAERMADYFIGHHAPMPGSGKTAGRGEFDSVTVNALIRTRRDL
jgi:hypothetical protein